MGCHTNRKGLDLPLAGAPAPAVQDGPRVTAVALLGADFVGLKARPLAQPGEPLLRGQPLLEDKSTGVIHTAPAAGTLRAIHRGERRAFVAAVIDGVDDDADPARQVPLVPPATIDRAAVLALLVASGLWTALRERPFNRVPGPAHAPRALFVTAMDTRPHAPPFAAALAGREDDFAAGVTALAHLTDGPVYVCKAPDTALPPLAGPRVQVEDFAGPHPAGNASWHIHVLHPVDLDRRVWHVGGQDVIAIGALFRRGVLDPTRVVSLAGPGVQRPRLLRTRLGASVAQLVAGELAPGEQRVISGSVLDGRAVTVPSGTSARAGTTGGPGPAAGDDAPDAFLGRYHAQVAVLPEGRERALFGWIAPGADQFSVTGTVLGAFTRRARALTTAQHGGPRAMVPIGSYERVLPFDILPTFLLRALITRDDEQARALGALELDEDDLALATCVCPGKTEYGPLLREALARIEKEAA